ncbi:abc transporter-like protein [Dermatophagoides farinae]|uniref:Abc transporter-like protein n=1 Tax=Dermatophagoides farinae TaxID=6954 RepID=A0A9D4NTF4_DERFA|nr:ABC transporter G family member 20-like [Dermatophagoides farinae]XP_046915989.1 ABC transporter G family member 20-like [Dermatophagoides farinae]KAH7638028.1 abc transporter-like protein [Dermatophagoides farinae]
MTAVQLSNVNFYYAKQRPILEDINLQVPYGKIYSLLGPSGAGKTTLLRLILGRIEANSGEIHVLGGLPGQNNRIVGYMPQDQALCRTFTVGQTLQYFANLYRLTGKEFRVRKQNLQKILGLPDDDKRISELSGGQQKIVSLSVTFLQRPKLMILDEPTVGSDPTLGDYIWKYLHLLCQQDNIVIIVVTHYIEEAVRAHIVGIMREGRMLEEDDPMALIERYEQRTLEDVFLYLCHNDPKPKIIDNDDNNNETDKIDEIIVKNGNHKTIDTINPEESTSNMYQTSNWSKIILNLWILIVLVHKNLSRFFQLNITTLIFLIPAFQALILGLMYDVDEVAIPIGVCNNEPDPYYSVRLFDFIEKVDIYYLKPKYYDNEEQAMNALKYGHIVGILIFDSNFTDAMITRVNDPDSMTNETYLSSIIRIHMDNSNFLFANGFIDSLRQTVYNFLTMVHQEQNLTRFEAPIDLHDIIYAKDSKLSDFLLPGYLIAFIYLSQLTISAQLLVQERSEGLFERSLVAGVSHNLVLLSHFFSSFVASAIQVTLMLYVGLFLFEMINEGPIWLVFTMVMAQALSSVATGLLISSVVKEGSTATMFSIFITFSQVFTSGTIFPRELVPQNFQYLVDFSPIGIPSQSLRNVMLRSWPITHPNVYNGLALNIISTIILLIISGFLFKKFS